jgi:hypothetical protein
LRESKWNRDCFTLLDKDYDQLKRVYGASMRQIGLYHKVAVMSFRRGGPNKKHELLRKFKQVLEANYGYDYSHFQSSFENSLFQFGSSDAAFAFETKNGDMASCATEAETKDYKSFDMAVNWYMEWLVVLHFIATHGGVLAVFDFDGEGAMSSSPNPAMELALLYQIFGEDLKETKEIRDNIQLVVITNSDLTSGVTIDRMVEQKLQNQQKQRELFKEAHTKCSRMLHGANAATYLRQWIADFAQFKNTSEVAYLQAALKRCANFSERTGYGEIDVEQWRKARATSEVA